MVTSGREEVPRGDAADLYTRLLTLSREARAAGRHEAGYHVLIACLHEAEADADEALSWLPGASVPK